MINISELFKYLSLKLLFSVLCNSQLKIVFVLLAGSGGSHSENRQPQVRNIPIQLEGNYKFLIILFQQSILVNFALEFSQMFIYFHPLTI